MTAQRSSIMTPVLALFDSPLFQIEREGMTKQETFTHANKRLDTQLAIQPGPLGRNLLFGRKR